MSDPLSSSDILDARIIGAGPTGLTMACELRRYGLSCRIVDQADAPPASPRQLVSNHTVEGDRNDQT